MCVPRCCAVVVGGRFVRNSITGWLVLLALGASSSAFAADGTWSSSASTIAWQTPTNWVSHIVPGAPSGTANTDTALFNSNSTTTLIVPDTSRNIENITFDKSAAAYTIGLTDGNPLALTAGGTLQIAATFSGANITETINAPLTLEGDYNLSDNAQAVGDSLTIGGAITGGAAGPQTLTVASGKNITTINGAISDGSGTIALVCNGGVLVLGGNNAFTGGVTINSGTLQIANSGALGSPASNDVSFGAGSAGVLSLNGNTVFVANLNTNANVGSPVIQNANASRGILSIDNAVDNTYAGVLQDGPGGGPLFVEKAGAGTLTLSGHNTFTGGVEIDAGSLQLGSPTALNAANIVFLTDSAILSLNGNSVSISVLESSGTTAIVQNQSATPATLTDNVVSSTTAYPGVLQDGAGGGALSLVKSGAGALVLSGNNTFSGGIALNAGTLFIGSNSALGLGTLTAGGGTLQAASDGTFAVGNAVRLNAALNVAGANSFTLGGPISGSGGLVKGGSSTLTLSHSESLAGPITVNGGTLRFSAVSGSATIGTGVTATVTGSATLELAGSVSALSSGTHRVNIINISTAPGLLVSGTHQQVGGIDGSGSTVVNAGSDLTANHIVQSSLVIGGTAASRGLVTIDASDSSGNPLDLGAGEQTADGTRSVPATLSSGFVLADSLQSTAPFASGAPSSSGMDPPSAEGFSGDPIPAGPGADPAAVPEPSTLVLLVVAFGGIVFMARRGCHAHASVDRF
ncbi:MAG TPA: autotransporter-associated beta strand repeat-containing protein [Pirellulales bacterium]|jgi:autotransporter-associated beta strand protein|nr:autotransporter-associated beta strand repeat-containing protein [Pirellulales bacterium]